jgi:hypothetical protein
VASAAVPQPDAAHVPPMTGSPVSPNVVPAPVDPHVA